jgi:fucose 4-O-acetylase-like acetyltransferase
VAGEAAPEHRPVAASARLGWLDLYRGLAVLVMIETHVVNTFLAAELRAGGWFWWLNYVNGLVAPAFLFIAGFAQGLGSRRPGVWPRLSRLAGVAAIGFALHFPWGELAAGDWSAALRVGTQVDILPCLAAAIAVLVLAQRLPAMWGSALVGLLAVIAIMLAGAAANWTGAPVPLVAWVNRTTGSLFPLLPWAAFAWIGFLVSARPPDLRVVVLAMVASAAAAFAFGRFDHSPTSAAFFFERLAWILALVPACAGIAQRWTPRAAVFAGQESLVMYVVHLLIIPFLAKFGLGSLGVGATAALYAAVLAGTYAATHAWRRVRLASSSSS